MFSLSDKLFEKINAELSTSTMKPALALANSNSANLAKCDNCKASCSAACKNSCTSLF